jgi:hypothetical protein
MSPPEPSTRRVLRILMWIVLGVIFVTPMAFNIYDHLTRRRPDLPDEKTAVNQLLAGKFAGPSYFQSAASGMTLETPSRQIYYVFIPKKSALAQVDRVITERKLGPDAAAKLKEMVDKLTEPPPVRTAGEDRVNLLMLNLALDALK